MCHKFITTPLGGIAEEEILGIVFEDEAYGPLASFLMGIEDGVAYMKAIHESDSEQKRYAELATETCIAEIGEDDTTIRRKYGDGAECQVETLHLWRLVNDWCQENRKHREKERQKRRDRVKLPFHFRTLACSEGVEYFSMEFEEGYEVLTVFLVFEAINFYPEIHRAFIEVLERGSTYRKIVLDACSLEIHRDQTKIFDELVAREEKPYCAINTEELYFLLRVWGDEWDRRREMFWDNYEAHRGYCKQEEERRQWKWEQKKLRKWPLRNKQLKPKGYWEKYKKSLKMDADGRALGVYAREVKIPGEDVKSYTVCFPKELDRQGIEDIIQEAYANKVCVIENAYMGRAKNGMKIALFLSDAGKILKAFPVY